MRLVMSIVGVVLAAGCNLSGRWLEGSSAGKIIESAILWDAKLDETWIPVDMAALVKDRDQFEPQGNFFKVRGELVVFGHRATYVGMLGVGDLPGPNATLSGSPRSIAGYLSRYHGARFSKESGAYLWERKKDIKIIIIEHPEIPGSAIVIGAYTGP